MKQTKTHPTLLLVVLLFFVFLFVFFIYTFLHEGGHALTGLLFGQSLTEFDVSFWDLSAHVGMTNGDLTQSQLAIRSVAGAGLPFLIWVIFINLVPRKSSFTLELLKLLSSMAVINTLLVWIILPLLFLFDKAPSDDVTYFLRYSQMPPLLLAGVATALYIVGWILFLSKINGLRNEFLLLSTTNLETLTAGLRKMVPVMASLMAFCVILVFTLNSFAAKNPLDRFSPPQGFVPVSQIDLSARAYPSETLTQFTLEKSAYVGVFIAVRDINTTYFDLSVIGPDDYSSTVLHGEGYNAAQDGGLWEQNLPPGAYRLVLTSHPSPGVVSIYWKTP